VAVWDYVSVEMWLLTGPLCIHWVMDEWIWNTDGMRIGRGEPKYSEKTLSQWHFFTIHYGLPWNWTLVISRLGIAIWIERLHNQSSTLLSVPEPKLNALYSIYNASGEFSIRCQIHIASRISPVEPVYLLWKHSSRNWTYISTQCLGTAVPPMRYLCVIWGD
jgi:hypothetical protein